MLKLGEKIISDIYLGDKKIAKVFLGDKLVYQANKPIFLDYVEFDGASWIDTTYKPNSNSSVSTTYYPYKGDAFTCIFGTQDTTTTNRFYAVISLTVYRLQVQSANTSGFWGISSTGLVNSANGTFASTQQKVGLTIDNYNKQISIKSDELTKTFDMTTYNSSLGTVDCQYNLLLGNRSTAGVQSTANAFKGKIHDFQIKESGELVQDLRPCIDPKGTVCFYDMVTKKYFYNQGTGTLKASGRFVESIVFDGASWIDTGIAQQTYTIECTVKLENTGYRQFLGGWNHIGGYYIAVDTSNRFELGSSAIVTNSNATELSNVVAEHTETEMILTVNGNYAKRTKQAQNEPNKNYWLGDLNSTSYSAPIKGQVRGHKFTSLDGVIIQDLRPYVDENGTACFKDVVTGSLFYNQGTGTLSYTE